MPKLTPERVREVLRYDPETGVFIWTRPSANRLSPGDIAGALNSDGYRLIAIDGERYKAHRLVMFITNGEWPPEDVDHINGNRSDNRLCNLRLATRAQNMLNRAKYRNNTSGHPGVSFHKKMQCYIAYVNVNGRRKYLGNFDSAELASAARLVAAKEAHGEFSRF